MRIAILYSWDQESSVGGVQNYIRFMMKHLGLLGHELRLFRPTFRGIKSRASDLGNEATEYIDLGRRLRIPGGPSHGQGLLGYISAYLNRTTYNLGFRTVMDAVLEWDPDIVWQQDLSASWLAGRSLASQKPIVLTNHTGEYLFLRSLALVRGSLPWLLRHFAAIIGTSPELTPQLPHAVFIANGADTDLCYALNASEKEHLRTRLFHEYASRVIILCPRRWAPTKGVLDFVRALKRLDDSEHAQQIYVVFAGDEDGEYPEYRMEIERRLRQLRLPYERLGSVSLERLIPYYQAADITIIPSKLEAVSLSAVESMFCGSVVLATKVGGMTSLIQQGRDGFLVPPGRADALADSIVSLLQRPELRAMVAERALQKAVKSYSWATIARQTNAVLVDVLERHTRNGLLRNAK